MDLPTSWYRECSVHGPRRTNKNLVGNGTSIRSGRLTPLAKRTNAYTGDWRKSTAPIKTLVASAFGGTFLRKDKLIYSNK